MTEARPYSIRGFEISQYVILALGLINSGLTYEHNLTLVRIAGHEPIFVILIVAFTFAILLLFVWLIAYRASNVAKWIFIAFSAFGLLALLNPRANFLQNGAISAAISLTQFALTAISVLLLFRRDSRDWFAGRRAVDPDIFS